MAVVGDFAKFAIVHFEVRVGAEARRADGGLCASSISHMLLYTSPFFARLRMADILLRSFIYSSDGTKLHYSPMQSSLKYSLHHSILRT